MSRIENKHPAREWVKKKIPAIPSSNLKPCILTRLKLCRIFGKVRKEILHRQDHTLSPFKSQIVGPLKDVTLGDSKLVLVLYLIKVNI